jgi:hypothetical protein
MAEGLKYFGGGGSSGPTEDWSDEISTAISGHSSDVDLHTGQELGYAERTTTDSTTNLADDNSTLNANLIAGLSVSVVGSGRPVEVEFYAPLVTHSVLNGVIYGTIMANGVRIAQVPTLAIKAGTGQGPLIVKRRMVLTDGVSYTFTAAKTMDTAGTGTYYASDTPSNMIMYLSVTQR